MSRTKFLMFALIVSVAINLFFVGGIAYRVNNLDSFTNRPLPPNVSWMVRDLSETRRAELQPLMERSAEEMRPVRRQMFDAQRRVNELMAGADFDTQTLEQAFAELRAANLHYQELSHEHSVAMLNQLTATERQAAVEFIQRRGPREGRDRRPDSDMPRDGRPFPDGPGRPPMPPLDNL